ncbi:MAG: HD domain-containing protein [Candidatus Eremiobacteraeota bacterium]|nr:HD domain-containing protein [Candidatus Eremiobacteraeota bacterium]
MNVAHLASSRVKSADADGRSEVVFTLLEAVPVASRSLLLELIARSFLDLFEAAAQSGNSQPLLEWADRMCDAHVEIPAVALFFAEVCGLLAIRGRAGNAHRLERALLRTLEPALREVSVRQRRSFQKPAAHVDELDAAIHALIARLERADPLSAEHSRAVSAWCTRLARRMALAEDEIVHVARCGLIHDVGKITTPTSVLHAARALTPEEWLIMRDHAPAGERIVLQDPRLTTFAPAVRSHHERLDGKGYPDAVPAGELSLYTRIVTVADCFNAMIGRRPYRQPMPPAVAMQQLEIHTGTQFDGAIVAAMRAVI